MRYFNGRVCLRSGNTHGMICANSKAEAVRVGKQAFGESFNIRELNNYWSERWGTFAEEHLGEQTEPAAFLEVDGAIFRFVIRERR